MSNINTTVPDNRDLSNFPGEYGLPFLGKTIEVVKDSIADAMITSKDLEMYQKSTWFAVKGY